MTKEFTIKLQPYRVRIGSGDLGLIIYSGCGNSNSYFLMGPTRSHAGGRPYRFRFDDNGEYYCIGSDVGNYLKVFRGHLYKKYPGLTRRTLTTDERKKLFDLGLGKYATVSQVTLLLATEVDEIIDGNEDFYKRGSDTIDPVEQMRLMKNAPAKDVKTRQSHHTGFSYSIHLDPVPQSTPICRFRGERNKRRMFPWCIDDLDPRAVDENALKPEELVPIRIELDVEGQKIRDSFVWNKNEMLITPEEFAESLCYDLGINPLTFVVPIASSMRSQIEAAPSAEDIPADPQCVTLKLNIQIGNVSLVDQIQWDLSEKANSPEKFAIKLCQELGLSGEFVTAISYSLRGQLSWQQKARGLPIEQALVNPPYRNPSVADQWAPFIETLTEAELEKKIRDQDRHIRRLRRVAL